MLRGVRNNTLGSFGKSFQNTVNRAAGSKIIHKKPAKIYELRTYTIKPECFAPFIRLTNEKIHLRTKYSSLLGYFTTELGGVNEVVHLWEYNSLAQRQTVRNALVGDMEWMNEYMAKMRPMLQRQSNLVLHPTSEDIISAFPEEDAVDVPVYELEFLMDNEDYGDDAMFRGGKFNEDFEGEESGAEANLEPAENPRQRVGELVGSWKVVIGDMIDSPLKLWRYKNLSAIDEVIEAERSPLESQQFNKIMFPTGFSPLQ